MPFERKRSTINVSFHRVFEWQAKQGELKQTIKELEEFKANASDMLAKTVCFHLRAGLNVSLFKLTRCRQI